MMAKALTVLGHVLPKVLFNLEFALQLLDQRWVEVGHI